MTTIYIVSDNGDLDTGFSAFLAEEASDTLGEVEVQVVSHASSYTAEYRELVNAAWDRWCALSSSERAEYGCPV